METKEIPERILMCREVVKKRRLRNKEADFLFDG
jgi:hypothetical protein